MSFIYKRGCFCVVRSGTLRKGSIALGHIAGVGGSRKTAMCVELVPESGLDTTKTNMKILCVIL